MSEFFDRLRADEKLTSATELVDALTDPATKDRLRTVLALSFSNVELKTEIVDSVIRNQRQSGTQSG